MLHGMNGRTTETGQAQEQTDQKREDLLAALSNATLQPLNLNYAKLQAQIGPRFL